MKKLLRAILDILGFLFIASFTCGMVLIGGATVMILLYISLMSDVINTYKFNKTMSKNGVVNE